MATEKHTTNIQQTSGKHNVHMCNVRTQHKTRIVFRHVTFLLLCFLDMLRYGVTSHICHRTLLQCLWHRRASGWIDTGCEPGVSKHVHSTRNCKLSTTCTTIGTLMCSGMKQCEIHGNVALSTRFCVLVHISFMRCHISLHLSFVSMLWGLYLASAKYRCAHTLICVRQGLPN